MAGIWETALNSIESRINRHYFEMWIKPLTCAQVDGDRIVLRAPNRYIKEWFEDNYLDTVLDEIRQQTQHDYRVVFEIVPDEPGAQSQLALVAAEPTPAADPAAIVPPAVSDAASEVHP